MLYAYARVRSIGRKGEIDWAQLGTPTVVMTEEQEKTLAKHLLQLSDVMMEVEQDLFPSRLCQYLFELSQKYNQFYDKCSVLQAEGDVRIARLVLCDLTARTLQLGLNLLGIEVLDRM
jgi:arginyl-tRNA synthetase